MSAWHLLASSPPGALPDAGAQSISSIALPIAIIMDGNADGRRRASAAREGHGAD